MSLQESITKQLQQTVLQKEEIVRQQNLRISSLETELKKSGYNRRIAQIVEPIQKPINELNLILRQICPKVTSTEKRTSDSMRWVKLIPALNTLLLLILLIIFVTVQVLDLGSRNLIGGRPEIDARINTLMCINDSLSEELASVKAEKCKVEELTVLKKYIKAIDLEEYNGGALGQGQYTLRPKIAGAKWKVDNATLMQMKNGITIRVKESNYPTVKMTPNPNDTVKICLSIDGKEIVRRNIPE